jgi:hypothetical protein
MNPEGLRGFEWPPQEGESNFNRDAFIAYAERLSASEIQLEIFLLEQRGGFAQERCKRLEESIRSDLSVPAFANITIGQELDPLLVDSKAIILGGPGTVSVENCLALEGRLRRTADLLLSYNDDQSRLMGRRLEDLLSVFHSAWETHAKLSIYQEQLRKRGKEEDDLLAGFNEGDFKAYIFKLKDDREYRELLINCQERYRFLEAVIAELYQELQSALRSLSSQGIKVEGFAIVLNEFAQACVRPEDITPEEFGRYYERWNNALKVYSNYDQAQRCIELSDEMVQKFPQLWEYAKRLSLLGGNF